MILLGALVGVLSASTVLGGGLNGLPDSTLRCMGVATREAEANRGGPANGLSGLRSRAAPLDGNLGVLLVGNGSVRAGTLDGTIATGAGARFSADDRAVALSKVEVISMSPFGLLADPWERAKSSSSTLRWTSGRTPMNSLTISRLFCRSSSFPPVPARSFSNCRHSRYCPWCIRRRVTRSPNSSRALACNPLSGRVTNRTRCSVSSANKGRYSSSRIVPD